MIEEEEAAATQAGSSSTSNSNQNSRDSNPPTVTTDRQWLAAFMLASGCQIVGAWRDNRRRVVYQLDDAGGRATSAMYAFDYGSPVMGVHSVRRAFDVVRRLSYGPHAVQSDNQPTSDAPEYVHREASE
jgi:hypothetical protein